MAKWIQKATESMERRGTKGSFSAAAKRAGKSTSAMATSVLKPGSHASAKMKKKAQFAKNVMGGNTEISTDSMKGDALARDPGANMSIKDAFAGGSDMKDNLADKNSFSAMAAPRLENGSALSLKTEFKRKHRKQLLSQKAAFGLGKNYGNKDKK